MHISNNKYYNFEGMTCKFSDFFPKKVMKDYILKHINDIEKIHLFSIISGMINMGIVDKSVFQYLSTVFLRHIENLQFEDLIKLGFFFTLADFDNETLYKKILDETKQYLICIKNFLDGNENMKNIIGIMDSKQINKLDLQVKINKPSY